MHLSRRSSDAVFPPELHTTKQHANPFVNRTRRLSVAQKVKVALMCIFMIPLIRIVLSVVLLLFVWLLCALGTCGYKPIDPTTGATRAMPTWRKLIITPARWLVRCILFVMGVYWINEKYPRGCGCCWKPTAPIIVANHVSFLDALYFACRVLPAFVAKSDVANYPIVGSILRALQPILVYRTKFKGAATAADAPKAKKQTKRKGALAQIIERVALARNDPRYPSVLIFPEGTTHNPTALTMFKRGAFIPAAPVQPVILRYPNCFHDCSWTPDVSLGKIAFLTLCQVYQRIDVEYLETYVPSGPELTDPQLYASNVRALMANKMGVPVTNHAFEDVKLLETVSKQYGLKHIVPVMDVAEMRSVMNLNFKEVQHVLERFRKADTNGDGNLHYPEFCHAMQLDADSPYSQRLFEAIDTDGSGTIDFREVALGLSWTSSSAKDHHKLRMAFDVYDTNCDGTITREELQRVLMTVLSLDATAAAHEIDDIMARVTTNEDGAIEFEEFAKLASGEAPVFTMAIDMARLRAGMPTITPKLKAVDEEGKEETKGEGGDSGKSDAGEDEVKWADTSGAAARAEGSVVVDVPAEDAGAGPAAEEGAASAPASDATEATAPATGDEPGGPAADDAPE